ncbi:hypothetical protein ACJX0J_028101, partial [Zea mays]
LHPSFLADKDAKVFVVGHRGFVRSAIVHHLLSLGFTSVVVHTRAKLDLTRSADLEAFFAAERLRYVGSIHKLLFLGSSCIYPKFALQPITEGALMCGPLKPTNGWYA